jgi:beta-glucosidase
MTASLQTRRDYWNPFDGLPHGPCPGLLENKVGMAHRSKTLFTLKLMIGDAQESCEVSSDSVANGNAPSSHRYKNPALTLEERVESLLALMTLEEKIHQLTSDYVQTCLAPNLPGDIGTNLKARLRRGMGSVQYVNLPHDAVQDADFANAIQRYVFEHTRLGIPVLLSGEACHGLIANKATCFPQAIALASTWNPALVKRVYDVAGRQARSRGNHLMNTPVLDLARDPRWGRMEETFGEDVYLVTQMGLAATSGLQGGGETVGADHVISAVKHFAGYGQCDGGRNFAPSSIPPRLFMEEILEPFRQVILKGHAWGLMPSHSEVDGIPAHGNYELLTGLLRKQWGFRGVVVSDYHDIHRLDILHRVQPSQKLAALEGLKAGVSLDFPIGASYLMLFDALEEHPEYLRFLNERVKEVLRVKFMLGLFDNPYVDRKKAEAIQNDPENSALALEAAEQAVILLKNKNRILPLCKDSLHRIAVIGPNAEQTILGGYTHWLTEATSLKDGLSDYLKDTSIEVVFAKGCGITAGGKTFAQLETGTETNSRITAASYEDEKASIAAAAAVAQTCEVAIVCVGDDYFSAREAFYLREALGDRGNIDLVGNQEALIKAVVETGTPTIVVLMHGRSLSINYTENMLTLFLMVGIWGSRRRLRSVKRCLERTTPVENSLSRYLEALRTFLATTASVTLETGRTTCWRKAHPFSHLDMGSAIPPLNWIIRDSPAKSSRLVNLVMCR